MLLTKPCSSSRIKFEQGIKYKTKYNNNNKSKITFEFSNSHLITKKKKNFHLSHPNAHPKHSTRGYRWIDSACKNHLREYYGPECSHSHEPLPVLQNLGHVVSVLTGSIEIIYSYYSFWAWTKARALYFILIIHFPRIATYMCFQMKGM